MKKHRLCFLFAGFSCVLAAQTVRVDTSFGVQGVVMTDLSDYTSSPLGVNMNLLPNGKTIIVGQKNDHLWIQQFQNNGARDTTFISAETPLRAYYSGSNVQQDGKLIASGTEPAAPHNLAVIRFKPNGTIDSTFGNAGIASAMISYNLYSNLFEQSDGKIVAFGALSTNNGLIPVTITRFNPDGSLDSSFALNGHFISQISQDYDIPNAGLEQPDGKLLFAGLSDNKILLLRLNQDGTPDPTFGVNGVVVDKSIKPAWAFGLAVQADGKIVITGYQSEFSPAIIARYHPNGSTDTGFGLNGVQYIQEGYKGVGVSIRPDGKIIAAIRGRQNSQEIAALVQLLPNGERDLSFGQGGVFFSGINQRVRNLTLAGNQVYVGAHTLDYYGTILRFLLDLNVGTLSPDTAPDPTLWLYPNPISEHLSLQFGLSQKAMVSVQLLDNRGKWIQSLVQNELFDPGDHILSLSCPAQMPAGNYVLSLEIDGKKRTGIQVTKI